MAYHKTVPQIIDLLKQNNFWFETFEHAPVRTSEEAAKIRNGYSLEQGAKAMIMKVKTAAANKFVMLVLPGDLRFDDKKIKKITGAKDIRLATEEEIGSLTDNIQVGGIPPFGNLFGLEVIADPKLFANEKIIFNAGDRAFSVAMKSKDYQKVVNPTIANITL